METYLLDTNIISDLADATSANHQACMLRLKAAARAKARILLPVMSIAEIEFGLHKGGVPDSENAREIRDFFAQYPLRAFFDNHCVKAYAIIRAKIFQTYGNRRGKRKKIKER
jgi:predicted nucleic acid-binding protein